MSEPFIVYGLVDSRDPSIVRYVGKTALSRRGVRLARHLTAAANGCQTYKARWIRTVLSAGRMVTDVILADAGSEADAFELERVYIARLKEQGTPLTNLTAGGEGVGGLRWSAESRQRISVQRRGRVTSEETRRKLSAAGRGRKVSDETRQKMSEASRRRPPSHYANSITSTSGWKHSDESKTKMRMAHLGKQLSLEQRLKIGESLRGRPIDLRHRENRRGRSVSVETRLKIGDGIKRAWAAKRANAAVRKEVAEWGS